MIVDCILVKGGSPLEQDLFYYTCRLTKEHLGFGYEFGVVHYNHNGCKLCEPYDVVVNDLKTI